MAAPPWPCCHRASRELWRAVVRCHRQLVVRCNARRRRSRLTGRVGPQRIIRTPRQSMWAACARSNPGESCSLLAAVHGGGKEAIVARAQHPRAHPPVSIVVARIGEATPRPRGPQPRMSSVEDTGDGGAEANSTPRRASARARREVRASMTDGCVSTSTRDERRGRGRVNASDSVGLTVRNRISSGPRVSPERSSRARAGSLSWEQAQGDRLRPKLRAARRANRVRPQRSPPPSQV